MNWHYAKDGAQLGPVDEAQFADLRYQGVITDETLVWGEDMSEWLPYGQVKASAAAVPAAAVTDSRCSVCGNAFPKDDLITHGNYFVCAGCKPVFMQRLAEGAPIARTDMHYAGFWIRFLAVFADGILLKIVGVVVGLILGLGVGAALGGNSAGQMSGAQIAAALIGLVIGFTYETYLIAKYGATFGKMACKIKVVTSQGEPVSYGRSVRRYFSKILSAIIFMVGYIMAGFDKEKRALHDRICDTRVIYK